MNKILLNWIAALCCVLYLACVVYCCYKIRDEKYINMDNIAKKEGDDRIYYDELDTTV